MAFRTVKMPVNKRRPGSQPMTEELKLAYENLQKRMSRIVEKQTINVRGRVYLIKGPFYHPFTFNGVTAWKRAFHIFGELKPSDVAGIRMDIIIPASLNEKAHFSNLWLATTGELPDPNDEEADVSPVWVTTRDVNFVIRKGKKRQDGGHWSNLKSFAPIWDDDTGELKMPQDEPVLEAWEEVEGENIEAMEAALAGEQATQAAAATLRAQESAPFDSVPDDDDLDFEE